MTVASPHPCTDAVLKSGGPTVECIDAARLSAEAAAWDDLAARARGTHPHYTRHVIDAHRAHGLAPADLGIVAVRRGGRLDAVLPYATGLDITGFGRAVARPFRSLFVTGTAPLVAADADGPTFDALVAGLREASGGRSWRWPLLSVETPAGAGLLDAMRRAGWSLGEVSAFERPVLVRRATHDAFLANHPNAGRLKDLRRRRRRLAEAGRVAVEVATAGEPLAAAVARFLALELAGWKGKAGSAMACRSRTEAFARTLFDAAAAGPLSVRADTLSLDDRPLAVSLALVAGGTACLLKTAYDEAARGLAPGLVLEAEIVRAMHETGFADRLDSATQAGSALESLYRERERVVEIVAVPPGGGSLLDIDRRVGLARFQHRARDEAKRLLRRD